MRLLNVLLPSLALVACQSPPQPRVTPEYPGLYTPDDVDSSIGDLEYFDGVPTPETVERVYDNLDRMRGVDAFLKGIPGASVRALMTGGHKIGAKLPHEVVMTMELLDSRPLFLTANTSTLYVSPTLDLETYGPTVMEVPPGMLGAFNDAWFRYLGDIGPAGPDKGKGGKFLVLPPGYEGEIPDGYHVVRSPTYRVWIFMRGSIANGLEAAVDNVKQNLEIYALSQKDDRPKMKFVNGSRQDFNTIHTNDYTFFEHLHELIDGESMEMLDPETRGLFASIGIEKGKPFAPDTRMKRILTDAVAIGNATARAIVWYPRLPGAKVYPDSDSSWVMAFAGKNVFFSEDGAMNSDARTMFHYAYTAVTPAMAVTIPGVGSDYAIAFLDSEQRTIDGSKTYRLHIPADVPVNDFWAVTLYDSQTRSQLQTSQPFPTLGSQSEGFEQNADGSYDLFFGPTPPLGHEGNWLETVPGKSWFCILRMYGPLEPWIEKTWRPGEVELVD